MKDETDVVALPSGTGLSSQATEPVCAVSAVPASIPSAVVRRFECLECEAIVADTAILTALNPFNPKDEILGCPVCRYVNDFALVCDFDDCDQRVSGGHPIPDGSYVNRCWNHSPMNKAFTASGIEARSDETLQAAQPEGQEPGAGTADAQGQSHEG